MPISDVLSSAVPLSAGIDLAKQSSAGVKPGEKRAHDAAQQFEAILIGEMMKTVREGDSGGWLGSGDDTGDDTAMEMGEGQFSQAMASHGGLGLGRLIEREVNQEQAARQNENANRAQLSIGSR